MHDAWANNDEQSHVCGAQFRTSFLATLAIAVSIALLWFIKQDDCLGGAFTWYGLMSAQVR